MRKLLLKTILCRRMALAAALLPTGAQAATLGDLFPPDVARCYAALFDEQQLARNPNQRITSVRLSTPVGHTSANKVNEVMMLDLAVSVRGGAKPMKTAGLICFKQDDNSWRCNEHVCNGRAITITMDGASRLILDLHDRRDGAIKPGSLTLEGACGSQDVEKQTVLELGGSDQVFNLSRVPPQTCRGN